MLFIVICMHWKQSWIITRFKLIIFHCLKTFHNIKFFKYFSFWVTLDCFSSPWISVFLLQQIKCQGNYMKIHFASAFPRQCFCWGWQDFILRGLVFTLATLAKTSTRSRLVKLLPLLHISPRVRIVMCTIIVVQIFLYKYYYMQCNVLFSHVKNVF